MTNTNGARKVKEDLEASNAIEEGDQRPTADEVLESINGFEEAAVEKAFGSDPIELAQGNKYMKFIRALVFVVKKREGLNDVQARQAAMEMPMSELQNFFVEPEEEEAEEAPKAPSTRKTTNKNDG